MDLLTDYSLEILTGIGLATSAGLNAYIPLLMIGLLGRYTELIHLPGTWSWLENGWVIGILSVLLAIEVVADKIPIIDHVNDAIQTVIRPTAGGLAFGAAASSQTVTVTDPGDFFSSNQWVPIVAGIAISFIVHSMKAAARPVINASTAGVGAPVASTAEDIFSVSVAFFAIIAPFLIIFFLIGLVWIFLRARKRRRQRRAGEGRARGAQTRGTGGQHRRRVARPPALTHSPPRSARSWRENGQKVPTMDSTT